MQITLPALHLEATFSGSKNKISHLVAQKKEVEYTVISQGRNHMIISCDENEIYLTNLKANIPATSEYAIKTSSAPTQEKLDNGELDLIWLKHPNYTGFTAEQVMDSWTQQFNFVEENQDTGSPGLREPQIAALYSILSHLKVGTDTATVVMPTGTGKTETMMAVLVAAKCPRLIVTVPSDALRSQLFKKFCSLGLLNRFGVVSENALMPKVGVLKNSFRSVQEIQDFLAECNVIITTMNIVASSPPDHQAAFSHWCTHLFIDEAHHVKAKQWNAFKNIIEPNKVIQFTATPFRNDKNRLEGRIIFNFPLRKAQEQGYFKQIDLIPLREYDPDKSDELIAEKAVERLREDIAAGRDHILLARCANQERARKVFEIYEKHTDLSPTLICSGINGKAAILQNIIEKRHKIIVAVDMLGEGFDLPQLKIAAFHDIRKSLPITLQFAGRFTRTSLDDQLGNASFVINLADVNVSKELDNLYAQDSDWNHLLHTMSSEQINEQIEFEDFVAGFQGLTNASIPFQTIRPALSTVIYKNHTNEWFPGNFRAGLSNPDRMEYIFHDINAAEHMMIIIYAEKTEVDWGNIRDIFQLNWNVIIVYWETRNNLLFIHGSDKSGLFKDMAEAIIGDSAELINQIDIFRAFHEIDRISLQNVGLKEFLGRHIKFRMTVGTDIEQALSTAETSRGQKAFVFGSGYEKGDKITLGCSFKGRVWSHQTGNLKSFKKWCDKIGAKVIDTTIDPNQILRNTLIPTIVTSRPDDIIPVWIDWNDEMYSHRETRYTIEVDGRHFNLSNAELILIDPLATGNIRLALRTDSYTVEFESVIWEESVTQDDGEILNIPRYSIQKLSANNVRIHYGSKNKTFEEFLEEYEPTIWLADGSSLTGNYYVELRQVISIFPVESLIPWDWTGVDLAKESQHVTPKIQDSIQFKVIQQLQTGDYDIIYDDDYSGEIADVITIKRHPDRLSVEFYHLKYASGGTTNDQVTNFYEVCGQAQKCIHWKHRAGREFFDHLLRRETKTRSGNTCSRLEKGTRTDLEHLLELAKREIPMEFRVYIVQPSLSKAKAGNSQSILTLLGVTENFLKETAAIDLNVIVNH